MRQRLPRRLALLAPLLLALGACGDLLQNVPPRPEASTDPAVAAAEYPRLADVPERPRLGYTLEQRRAIAEGLVADRANARHTGDELRRATGRPVTPDDAPPLPPLPPPPEVADDTSTDLALAYVEEALARDSDDGSLGDFLDRLERPPPGIAARPPAAAVPPTAEDAAVTPAGPEPLAETAATAPAATVEEDPAPAEPPIPAETAAPAAAEPSADAVTAASEPSAALATATAPATAPGLPVIIRYVADLVEPPPAERERAVAGARQLDARSMLIVSGGGTRPGLAMERARRIAVALVAAGIAADRIVFEMAGDSDVVIVYEAAGEAG